MSKMLTTIGSIGIALTLLTSCGDDSSGPSPGSPETVDDLEALDIAVTSVTLGWTQVDDGQGSAPDYLVRYGSPTITWEAANGTEVIVDGTGVGLPTEHTYTGLTAETDYQFQVVAFRGTTIDDVVPGGLSNIASFTTLAALAAGASSAVGGAGQVVLSAQAPTGGVPPYAYQWYRDGSSGFVPGPGNMLVGLTALDETDAGLADGTTYYYVLVATDDTDTSAAYDEVSATTLAALTAGSSSAVGGNGEVVLSADAATGGVPPYTYQWHRSTSSGFVPGPGNALGGFTSLSETDTGLVNGTTYYYVLVATDDLPTSVEYAEVSATPTAPDLSHPNLPSGMSVIAEFDGTVEQSGNDAFGIPDFGSWLVDGGAPADVIEVVADPTNPNGSGSSLRFTFNQAYNPRSGIASANTFSGGPFNELYIHLWIFFESDWSFGSKIFYVGATTGSRNNGGSPTQFYNVNSGARHRFHSQNSGAPETELIDSFENPPKGINERPLVSGQWVRVEYHLIAESAPGADDGEIYTWIDGVNAGFRTGVGFVNGGDPAVGFDGLEWYADVNDVPVESYYRLGEMYIAGK